jgi:hypothetical protein
MDAITTIGYPIKDEGRRYSSGGIEMPEVSYAMKLYEHHNFAVLFGL